MVDVFDVGQVAADGTVLIDVGALSDTVDAGGFSPRSVGRIAAFMGRAGVDVVEDLVDLPANSDVVEVLYRQHHAEWKRLNNLADDFDPGQASQEDMESLLVVFAEDEEIPLEAWVLPPTDIVLRPNPFFADTLRRRILQDGQRSTTLTAGDLLRLEDTVEKLEGIVDELERLHADEVKKLREVSTYVEGARRLAVLAELQALANEFRAESSGKKQDDDALAAQEGLVVACRSLFETCVNEIQMKAQEHFRTAMKLDSRDAHAAAFLAILRDLEFIREVRIVADQPSASSAPAVAAGSRPPASIVNRLHKILGRGLVVISQSPASAEFIDEHLLPALAELLEGPLPGDLDAQLEGLMGAGIVRKTLAGGWRQVLEDVSRVGSPAGKSGGSAFATLVKIGGSAYSRTAALVTASLEVYSPQIIDRLAKIESGTVPGMREASRHGKRLAGLILRAIGTSGYGSRLHRESNYVVLLFALDDALGSKTEKQRAKDIVDLKLHKRVLKGPTGSGLKGVLSVALSGCVLADTEADSMKNLLVVASAISGSTAAALEFVGALDASIPGRPKPELFAHESVTLKRATYIGRFAVVLGLAASAVSLSENVEKGKVGASFVDLMSVFAGSAAVASWVLALGCIEAAAPSLAVLAPPLALFAAVVGAAAFILSLALEEEGPVQLFENYIESLAGPGLVLVGGVGTSPARAIAPFLRSVRSAISRADSASVLVKMPGRSDDRQTTNNWQFLISVAGFSIEEVAEMWELPHRQVRLSLGFD